MSSFKRDLSSTNQNVLYSFSGSCCHDYRYSIPLGRWKKHPIYVTAYSYFFGALFMGLGSLYYVGTGQYTLFKIPQDVRAETIVWYKLIYVLL